MVTNDSADEPPHGQPVTDHTPAQRYEIRVRGHLGTRWATWFDGMTLTEQNDETVISGPVIDQAALHGLLQKLRNLGITLVSLTCLTPGTSAERRVPPTTDPV